MRSLVRDRRVSRLVSQVLNPALSRLHSRVLNRPLFPQVNHLFNLLVNRQVIPQSSLAHNLLDDHRHNQRCLQPVNQVANHPHDPPPALAHSRRCNQLLSPLVDRLLSHQVRRPDNRVYNHPLFLPVSLLHRLQVFLRGSHHRVHLDSRPASPREVPLVSHLVIPRTFRLHSLVHTPLTSRQVVQLGSLHQDLLRSPVDSLLAILRLNLVCSQAVNLQGNLLLYLHPNHLCNPLRSHRYSQADPQLVSLVLVLLHSQVLDRHHNRVINPLHSPLESHLLNLPHNQQPNRQPSLLGNLRLNLPDSRVFNQVHSQVASHLRSLALNLVSNRALILQLNHRHNQVHLQVDSLHHAQVFSPQLCPPGSQVVNLHYNQVLSRRVHPRHSLVCNHRHSHQLYLPLNHQVYQAPNRVHSQARNQVYNPVASPQCNPLPNRPRNLQ